MGKTVNRQELADIFGYSLPTISAWVENGTPVKSHGGRGKQFEFDTEDVLKWLLARERAERKAHTAATLKEGGEEITIDKARLRNEIAKAKLSELELATKMELVRPIDMVAKPSALPDGQLDPVAAAVVETMRRAATSVSAPSRP